MAKWAIFCLLLTFSVALGQQFPLYQFDYEAMNLSAPCVEALNTSIGCSDFLATQISFDSSSVGVLGGEDEVAAVCVDGCRADLLSVKATIAAACTSNADIMVYQQIAYPATLMADKYIYAYDISCYKHQSTGKYCDLELASLRNETNETTSGTYDCSDCILGPIKVQLEAPVAFDDEAASVFASLTVSCQATGYSYTKPTNYALNSTTVQSTATPSATDSEPRASCTNSYVIQTNDTCNSIALAQNISEYSLIHTNNLDIFCLDLPEPGNSVCLPLQCETYRLTYTDTCPELAATYNVSTVQFLSWNPNFDRKCINLDRWRGMNICVGPPGGAPIEAPTTTATAVPVPTDANSNSNTNCASWHLVVPNDECYQISKDAGITLENFHFLNPDLDSSCGNLYLGLSYCVRAVGTITTYPGYPIATATGTFTRPVSATKSSYVMPEATLNPTAAGTIGGCAKYQNSVDTSVLLAAFGNVNANLTINDCMSVALQYGTNVTDLLSWNPSLTTESCELQVGFSYCVELVAESETTSLTTATPTSTTTSSQTSTSTTTTAIATPSPTRDGMISTCKVFYYVVANDGCWDIANTHGILLDNFYSWNPAVKTDCSGLWPDYYVCVGI